MAVSLGRIHSSQKILQFPGLEPTILPLQPRMFLSGIRNMELGLYGTKAVSMFWGLEKISYFSPVDGLQSSNLKMLSVQVKCFAKQKTFETHMLI